MAYYALINSENKVVHVIKGVDENLVQIDLDGTKVGGSSEAWESFYEAQPWFSGLYCKRTSYNGNIRKNYASIGFTYDVTRDAFIAPKPFNSWLLNEENCKWESPKPYPMDDNFYVWDEDLLNWKPVNNDTEN